MHVGSCIEKVTDGGSFRQHTWRSKGRFQSILDMTSCLWLSALAQCDGWASQVTGLTRNRKSSRGRCQSGGSGQGAFPWRVGGGRVGGWVRYCRAGRPTTCTSINPARRHQGDSRQPRSETTSIIPYAPPTGGPPDTYRPTRALITPLWRCGVCCSPAWSVSTWSWYRGGSPEYMDMKHHGE